MDIVRHIFNHNQWIQLQSDFAIGRFSHIIIHSDTFVHLIYVLSGNLQFSSSSDNSVGNFVLLPLDTELQISDIDCIIFRLPKTVFPASLSEIISLDLASPDHLNKWIVGYGNQAIKSTNFSLAYVTFEDQIQFENQLLPREFYHKHHFGIEYYLVLEGSNTVEVNGKKTHLDTLELLEVPTGLCHHWVSAKFPQKGFNFRYPSIDKDKELCN